MSYNPYTPEAMRGGQISGEIGRGMIPVPRAMRDEEERIRMEREDAETRRLLRSPGSRFYDNVNAPTDINDRVRISVGDVQPVTPNSPEFLSQANIVGNNAFMPPAELEPLPQINNDYRLNEAGQAALSTMDSRQVEPTPRNMPIPIPELMQSAGDRGIQYNPQTGEVSLTAPQRPPVDETSRILGQLINAEATARFAGYEDPNSVMDNATSRIQQLIPVPPQMQSQTYPSDNQTGYSGHVPSAVPNRPRQGFQNSSNQAPTATQSRMPGGRIREVETAIDRVMTNEKVDRETAERMLRQEGLI